jgi:hypothetical protein
MRRQVLRAGMVQSKRDAAIEEPIGLLNLPLYYTASRFRQLNHVIHEVSRGLFLSHELNTAIVTSLHYMFLLGPFPHTPA